MDEVRCACGWTGNSDELDAYFACPECGRYDGLAFDESVFDFEDEVNDVITGDDDFGGWL